MPSKILLLFVLLFGASLGAWARGAISATHTPAVPYGTDSVSDTGAKSSAPSQLTSSDDTENQLRSVIVRLQEELDLAREEHELLREQVFALEERLENSGDQPASASAAATASKRARLSGRGSRGLTIDALMESGVSERDARMIKSRIDEIAMQRLYLRDQAMREGWVGKEQYRNEIKRINEAQNNLENEFGEENFDRYLYSMGRPNRVSVQSVIENSPAANAGIQSGDRIISYGNDRIYNANEIRRGTQSGQSGELVPVVVMRDGRRVDMYIPRGPLGVQMNSESIQPSDKP